MDAKNIREHELCPDENGDCIFGEDVNHLCPILYKLNEVFYGET